VRPEALTEVGVVVLEEEDGVEEAAAALPDSLGAGQ
jgi:hypothetical protein